VAKTRSKISFREMSRDKVLEMKVRVVGGNEARFRLGRKGDRSTPWGGPLTICSRGIRVSVAAFGEDGLPMPICVLGGKWGLTFAIGRGGSIKKDKLAPRRQWTTGEERKNSGKIPFWAWSRTRSCAKDTRKITI